MPIHNLSNDSGGPSQVSVFTMLGLCLQVVDGAAWIWRPMLVTRDQVAKVSRGIEAKSRSTGLASQKSKL